MNGTEKIGCCGAYCGTCREYLKTCKGCKPGYLDGSRDLNRARCKMKKCCLTKGHITCADCEEYEHCETVQAFQPFRLQILQIQAGTGVHPHPRLLCLSESGGTLDRRLRQVPEIRFLKEMVPPAEIRGCSAGAILCICILKTDMPDVFM